MGDNNGDDLIVDTGEEFTERERMRLRRILRDDEYSRRFKTTIKVWTVTLGIVASAITATKVLLGEAILRLFK